MNVPEGTDSPRKYQKAYKETIRLKSPKFGKGNAQQDLGNSKYPKEDKIKQIYRDTL